MPKGCARTWPRGAYRCPGEGESLYVRIGNSPFNVKDPDGHTWWNSCNTLPDGWTGLARKSKFLWDTPASRTGWLGTSASWWEALDAAPTKLYGDNSASTETWRGITTPPEAVELGQHEGARWRRLHRVHALQGLCPRPISRGTQHHLCLIRPGHRENRFTTLNARTVRQSYTRPLEIRTGVNRKRQLNLFDHDGTRVELMEPHTIDGRDQRPGLRRPRRGRPRRTCRIAAGSLSSMEPDMSDTRACSRIRRRSSETRLGSSPTRRNSSRTSKSSTHSWPGRRRSKSTRRRSCAIKPGSFAAGRAW